MYSFISSFKKLVGYLLRERSVRTLLLALAMIILFGFLFSGMREPDRKARLVEDRFWAFKTRFLKTEYNVVLCGDSRIYRGLSPAEMHSCLPDSKIINFGYSLGGLDRMMLKNAEALLDPKAKSRIIVLGVTPSSLTPIAAENEQYLSLMRKPFSEMFETVYFLPLKTYLMPMFPGEIKSLLSGVRKKSDGYHKIYHDDGWVASWYEVPRPEEQLPMYKARFESYQVSPHIWQDMLQVVQEWKSRGIQTVGFRPPSTRAMVALEDSMSGFREAEFIKEFINAGGIWLSFNIDDYVSYDGSHLEADSAKKLSRDLADKIQLVLSGESFKYNMP